MCLFQDKVVALASKLNSLHISSCDILLGFRVHLWPAIKHMDPVLHLYRQINMLRKFHRSLFLCVQVNRNFPCMLILIFPSFGDLDLKTLELEQGVESISHLISLWDASTPDSNLLPVSFDFLQLEVGTTHLALNKILSPCSQISIPGWFTSVWVFIDTHQL